MTHEMKEKVGLDETLPKRQVPGNTPAPNTNPGNQPVSLIKLKVRQRYEYLIKEIFGWLQEP